VYINSLTSLSFISAPNTTLPLCINYREKKSLLAGVWGVGEGIHSCQLKYRIHALLYYCQYTPVNESHTFSLLLNANLIYHPLSYLTYIAIFYLDTYKASKYYMCLVVYYFCLIKKKMTVVMDIRFLWFGLATN
jgi:hypothetical protein